MGLVNVELRPTNIPFDFAQGRRAAKQRPLGLKALVGLNLLRGAEAPLFHGIPLLSFTYQAGG
jgi:hypothetical protein